MATPNVAGSTGQRNELDESMRIRRLVEGVLMASHLTLEQRQLARRLGAKGLSLREIARQVGCSHDVVRTVVGRESKHVVRSDGWRPGPGRLTLADREEIGLGLRGGLSLAESAARLGKGTATGSRGCARGRAPQENRARVGGEGGGNGGRHEYRAWRAQVGARQRARRLKPYKLGHAKLVAQVSAWLQDWSSTQEITHRLRMEFADDPKMHVSHETIYQSLF